MASHELKTPLTSIKGFTQILQRHFKQRHDDESLQLLGKVEMQIHRLTQLVNEMLSIAQIDMGKDLAYHLGIFDLRDVVHEIIDNVRSAYIDYQFSLDEHEPLPVNGDQERIAQVLINLLNNAIKYSHHSKQIVIRTAIHEDSAVISIRDFGIGIPARQQQKIFEKFYRVDDAQEPLYPGLGVGLYLSSAIIQRHHGRIWVESKEGEGSTFYFSLPLFIMK
jgi:signal transduction histidine kinase